MMRSKIPIFMFMMSIIGAIFPGCGKVLPKGGELRGAYFAHRQSFHHVIALLKTDGAFSKADGSQTAALLLNPLGPRSSREIECSEISLKEYKRSFEEIGLQSPALVFDRTESVIFVIGAKGMAIGGGGAIRGIAYVAHPERNHGFRVVQTDREAESSAYGGVDLVPIEGDWYLYYANPS